MHNFKLFLAIMLAVAVVQLHGSEELPRIGSLSTKTSYAAYSQLIQNLQNNQINPFMKTIKPREHRIDTSYSAAHIFLNKLVQEQMIFDGNDSDIRKEIAVGGVSFELGKYGVHKNRVASIVDSLEFQNLKVMCKACHLNGFENSKNN